MAKTEKQRRLPPRTLNLSPKQLAFARAYATHGVAERAAVDAGYSPKTARGSSARLLANAGIKAEMARLVEKAETHAVADAIERKEFWTRVMRDTEGEMKDRLKASELLGKTGGDFIDRVDSTGTMTVRVVRE